MSYKWLWFLGVGIINLVAWVITDDAGFAALSHPQ